MSWARLSNRNSLVSVFRGRGHFLGPVLPVTIFDADSNGGPQSFTPANTGTNLHFVFLDQHSTAAAVALLAAPKIVVDFTDVDRKSRRHSVNDHGQTGSVGFTRSEIA